MSCYVKYTCHRSPYEKRKKESKKKRNYRRILDRKGDEKKKYRPELLLSYGIILAYLEFNSTILYLFGSKPISKHSVDGVKPSDFTKAVTIW